MLYVKSELTDNRWRIYSDNIAMARWLQMTVQGMLNAELLDTSIPVTDAEFSKTGDPRYFWTERMATPDEDVTLTWYDIGDPLLIHTQPNSGRAPLRRVHGAGPGPRSAPDTQRRRRRRPTLEARARRPAVQHQRAGVLRKLDRRQVDGSLPDHKKRVAPHPKLAYPSRQTLVIGR